MSRRPPHPKSTQLSGLTEDADFDGTAAVQLLHTLHLGEGDEIARLEAVTSLIQACHLAWAALGEERRGETWC